MKSLPSDIQYPAEIKRGRRASRIVLLVGKAVELAA
jgi:hypothetical protein